MQKHTLSRRDFVKFGAVGAGMLAFSGINAQAAVAQKDVKFDEEFDVVVIGSGFAGLAAGVKAAERGKKVLILEKMGRVGGNSAINGGVMAVPMNKVQEKNGIKDSAELFKEDCLKAGLNINHTELLDTIAARANDALEFVVKHGAQFKDSHNAWMGGHSVARSMITTNDSGSGIVQPLAAAFEKFAGCKLLKRTKMDDFVVDDSGRVVGVTAREEYKFDGKLFSDDLENTSGTKKAFKAKDGVVLASGGFCNDKILRKLQDPRIPDNVDSTNHQGATAGVLLKALKLGAMPVHIDWIQFGPWASPDERGFGSAPILTQQGTFKYGIAVDVKTGKRFMNELADRKTRADAEFKILVKDPKAFPVTFTTKEGFRELNPELVEKAMTSGVMKEFATLDDLAKNYGVPAAELKASVAKYNEGVKAGKDEFGKKVDQLKGEGIKESGPYYAIRLSPKPHHTMGGLKINTKAQVISSDTNAPIAGLYAAGEITGGTHGASRLGSNAITDCIVFGMIAGENL
ncbi:flavocytochrome c [Campylobacter sp.]|uniref:flavocytochrome c n=1 Tax=Campylobacter sp. TaxID=205 RepID=UPI0026F5C4B8|nr:flavocytochrome c [Campylobacter sp.]